MGIQKLTPGQKRIRKWRIKRNKLVCKLMDRDPRLTSYEALAMANDKMKGSKHT